MTIAEDLLLWAGIFVIGLPLIAILGILVFRWINFVVDFILGEDW